MNKSLIGHSKFLSLVLRHQPQAIELKLDAEGWASIDELLRLAKRHGRDLRRDILNEVVRSNDKQRFSISPDGERIRANQGHSVTIDLALPPMPPPPYLYHGTACRFLDSIRKQGLMKQQRHHVHLSADRETAVKVGQRHGTPIVLTVLSEQMSEAGFTFYQSENGVWLTDHVPAAYLSEEHENSR